MNQILFDNVATFNEWGIYLSSYSIGDAEPKEHYIDIPSGDGSIDLTESLTGDVTYSNRDFEATFTIKPPQKDWLLLLAKINAFLNGRKRKIRVANEPGYYLLGRCKTTFEKDGVVAFLTVTASCEPWRYKEQETIYNLTIPASGQLEVNCKNSRKRVLPVITVSDEVTVVFGNKSITMNAGSYKYTNIRFVEGDNKLIITGTAGTTIAIEYQEGGL